ncbi:porin [Psychromonas hadalis]|uniref:porin n=1 Tax=Psychromonas hadalis TaxID=211669 RepID=UPI0003B70D46|nr:porin [Psychromonas hadalis]
MFKKTAICIALSALFVGVNAQAATIYENENGDNVKVYGEVGVGGHFSPNYEYAEYFEDKSYIDDSFATMGIKGNYDSVYYRLELDYERENWKYGSGEMVLAIDKLFIGYHITDNHAVEFGLTDTALDDYDKFGDFTFDTTVETGEAGDQANTIKYEGNLSFFKAGVSYSYQGESSSGAALGDVVNGYFGYFSDYVDVVAGAETRTGSEGKSKYGEQVLYALGARIYITDSIAIGINAYIEDEDIAQSSTVIDNTDPLNTTSVYNDYQTMRNKGGLVSARYKLDKKWEFTGSYNFEEYEKWDVTSPYGVSPDREASWGKERVWGTVGVNFRPSRSVIFAVEGSVGEAAQDAYAYARVYF